jgi:hypothetical protein
METDDQFLHSYRRDPTPGFARRLRERLRGEEESRTTPAWRSLVFAAAGIAVVAALFALPAVRAGAQAMLDLFRVRSFVAVPFKEDRFEKLRSLENNNGMVVFDHKTVIQDPGPPVVQSSPAAASAAVGFSVGTPSYLPEGFALDSIAVTGEGRARLSVSSARLRELLATLDLRDVEVPAGLDGQELEVHMHPAVGQRFSRSGGKSRLTLMQARSPEVSLPAGVDLEQLATMGLRILGLDAGEAQRIASTVDWRSTLLVPVPMNASSFRSITVRGNTGLLVTTESVKTPGQERRAGSVILWTEGDRVFALQGSVGSTTLLQVAESIR